jgi:hypothetical protein
MENYGNGSGALSGQRFGDEAYSVQRARRRPYDDDGEHS